jgi:hypothetical protein
MKISNVSWATSWQGWPCSRWRPLPAPARSARQDSVRPRTLREPLEPAARPSVPRGSRTTPTGPRERPTHHAPSPAARTTSASETAHRSTGDVPGGQRLRLPGSAVRCLRQLRANNDFQLLCSNQYRRCPRLPRKSAWATLAAPRAADSCAWRPMARPAACAMPRASTPAQHGVKPPGNSRFGIDGTLTCWETPPSS